jgi:hypothetical protein
MKIGAFWELGGVSDQQLRSGLAALLVSGYRTEARIVAHIAEVEERKLHLKEGSSSLFEYCVKKLGLSESEAFHRLTAARIARRFPVVFAMIERREVHLTAVCLLRDYLTPENHLECSRSQGFNLALAHTVRARGREQIVRTRAAYNPEPIAKRPCGAASKELPYLVWTGAPSAFALRSSFALHSTCLSNPSTPPKALCSTP